jgi:hypothetical protein
MNILNYRYVGIGKHHDLFLIAENTWFLVICKEKKFI